MKRFGLILFFIFTVFLFLTFTSTFAYSFSNGGCEGDCKKCHSLSTQEANGILKKMNLSRAKILNIQLSPVKSLWEISIEDNGKKGIFYVDFSKKYLLSGQIIEVDTGSNKTAESAQRIPAGKADVSKIPINNALVMGNARAPKKVIVFTDPD
ncbi:disulfide isomerase DsbC N-terminal domain-containing protein [Dissulfurispira sp.]|uniref:disulfide isomerase DsbC N-terminal domain-containing protein n=1 Tax=Dissulfurispira sp. TaxID=2817609 RepID=UPI002FD889A4